MANLVLTENGTLLNGTPENDTIAFGIYIVDSVPFTTAGTVLAGAGNDDIFTLNPGTLQNGVQLAYGNEGDDNIRLSGLYIAYGGQGNDSIESLGVGGGADFAGQNIFGGQGNDTIRSGGGNDSIEGNQQNDLIFAGDGLDFVLGGQDQDTINGEGGNDVIFGNLGNDSILGGLGSDLINGGQGTDRIFGLDENTLKQDGATDTIIGGAGADTLTGGRNNAAPWTTVGDIFRYQAGSGANVGIENIDYITNFKEVGGGFTKADTIQLAVGDGEVLAGRNFTATTDVNVNIIPVIAAGAGTITTYTQAIAAIQTAIGTPTASTNTLLQVYNIQFTAGDLGGSLVQDGSANANNFLFINNGDTVISPTSDMFIQGVNVAAGDIVFA